MRNVKKQKVLLQIHLYRVLIRLFLSVYNMSTTCVVMQIYMMPDYYINIIIKNLGE